MVKIVARCHPALRPILPEPTLAARALPSWVKTMPSRAASPSLGGIEVRTLKHCPPLLDALTEGLLIPLAADVTVRGGALEWDWSPPPIPDQLTTRAPVGLHAPEQATGVPLPLADRFVVKFMNFWTIETPPGWSVLFTHPLNREDLPFRTLSGVVECDRFADGLVHFPALWTEPDFEGVLAAGTPVAQAIPIQREEVELVLEEFDPDHAARTRAMQAALQNEPGHYRKLRKRPDPEGVAGD